jgi:hypothetical protein
VSPGYIEIDMVDPKKLAEWKKRFLSGGNGHATLDGNSQEILYAF